MFVGSLHPRKNLARLFTAFDLFKGQTPSNVKLLIVGEKRWWSEPIEKAYSQMRFKEDVVFAGRLSAEDLHLVTASALASVVVLLAAPVPLALLPLLPLPQGNP
jgi:glycosyltransferase involved in cell wall biosynthesis